MKIKAGILFGKEDARMIEREMGELQNDEIIIKVSYCNLCTTDYQQWQGLRDHQGFPMAGGHENSGTVVKVGSDVQEFSIGDKVALGYNYCGKCDNCRKGLTFECENEHGPGRTEDGYVRFLGLANYERIKANRVVKLSADTDLRKAAFLEPLGTVIHGVEKLNIKPGQTVVVIGAGTMGILNALVAKSYGADVIVSELQKKQLQRAENAGLRTINSKEQDPVQSVKNMTDGKGADIVIGAVGASKAYDQAFEMLKAKNGKFLVFAAGYPAPELNIAPNDIHYREIQVIGTFGGNIKDFITAGEYISKNMIDVSQSLEGKLIGLKDINEAYAAAAEPGTYRITVDCQEIE